MAKILISGSGKPGFLRRIKNALFGKKDNKPVSGKATTETTKEPGLNMKNSRKFDRGNIERRFYCRSSQSKRRKLEHRRGQK